MGSSAARHLHSVDRRPPPPPRVPRRDLAAVARMLALTLAGVVAGTVVVVFVLLALTIAAPLVFVLALALVHRMGQARDLLQRRRHLRVVPAPAPVLARRAGGAQA